MVSWIPYLLSACLHHFQSSLPVQPGNSGGALVDARGNVAAKVPAHGHRVRRRRWRPPGRCRSPRGRITREEQPALELPGVGAGRGGKTQGAKVFADGHSAV